MLGLYRALDEDMLNDQFFSLGNKKSGQLSNMKMDLKENEQGFEAVVELPGYKKEDVKIHFEDQVLTVSASKETVVDETKDKYHYKERQSGYVERSVTFPKTADLKATKANFDNGELKLTIPRVHETVRKSQVLIE